MWTWSFLSSFCLDVWSQALESGLSQPGLRDALVWIRLLLLEGTEIDSSLLRVGHAVLSKTVAGHRDVTPLHRSVLYVREYCRNQTRGQKNSLSISTARSAARRSGSNSHPYPEPQVMLGKQVGLGCGLHSVGDVRETTPLLSQGRSRAGGVETTTTFAPLMGMKRIEDSNPNLLACKVFF